MTPIPTLFLLAGGSAVIAVAGFLVVHRVIKPIDLDANQKFLDAMLSIVGTLVSILLGLLVAAALDHYRTLEQSVDTEAACVAQIYRLTLGLAPDKQKEIRQLCTSYSDTVVNDEWPAMEKGHGSNKVLLVGMQLMSAITNLNPTTNGETNLQSAMISSFQQMADARRQRLLVLHSTWAQQLMPVLLMCSGIVLAFAYLYVTRRAVLQGFLIGLVAIALGGNLGLVYLWSNPFRGDWKIVPRGFELNRQFLIDIKATPDCMKLLEKVKE